MNFIKLKHFTDIKNLTSNEVIDIIKRAEYFKKGGKPFQLNKKVYIANLFFENSTRTHTSFEMAERKLGLEVIPFDPSASSIKKGETLYDTLLTLQAIGINLVVIRHSQNEYYNSLINLLPNQKLNVGIINAGDGSGQHPSQSLLDMMTIYEQFNRFKGLKIVIIGDITNSRVAKSNMQLLNHLGAEIYFSGPKYWYDAEFNQYGKYVQLDEIIEKVDVVMLLRVQHERHSNDKVEQTFSKEEYHKLYGLNKVRYDLLKDDAIIMHPGPVNRDVEWSSELVESDKSRFVEQMQNGVFMRMAMIETILLGRKLGGLE